MSKKLGLIIPEKNDALSRIKKYMSNHESGVVLNATEEKMLSRYMYAHGLLSERKYTREQVAEKIKELHGVSIHTARIDINNTYSLIFTVTDDYKRYTLVHHIEFIEQKIRQWENDKSLASLLPKLLAEKTRAILALPVEQTNPDVPAPVIIINTTVNITPKMNIVQAMAEADKLIEFEKNHEEIEFQDLPDDKQ